MRDSWIHLQHDQLDVQKVADFLYDPRAGGVDIFVGTTRQWTDKKETIELGYECYEPMALKEMDLLVIEVFDKWPVVKACVLHRLGIVPVAEASVIIGVSTPHRGDAFEATRYLIDRLKVQVPIWKKEHYTDGSTEWVQGKSKPDISE